MRLRTTFNKGTCACVRVYSTICGIKQENSKKIINRNVDNIMRPSVPYGEKGLYSYPQQSAGLMVQSASTSKEDNRRDSTFMERRRSVDLSEHGYSKNYIPDEPNEEYDHLASIAVSRYESIDNMLRKFMPFKEFAQCL